MFSCFHKASNRNRSRGFPQSASRMEKQHMLACCCRWFLTWGSRASAGPCQPLAIAAAAAAASRATTSVRLQVGWGGPEESNKCLPMI